MSESTRFFRDLLALSGGELASKLIAFAAFAYLARVLQPEAYGSLELAVSLALSFAMLIDFGLSPIGAREVARNPSESARLAARIPTARLVVALLAIPAMGLLVLAMRKPAETVQLVWLFALSLVALPFTQRWLFQGLEKMLWVSAGGVIRMGVFALGVVIWVREPADLVHIGVVEVCSLSAVAVYFLGAQRSQVTPLRLSLDPPEVRRLLSQGAALGLAQMVWTFSQFLPIMLMGFFFGGMQIAWFGAAQRIVMSLGSFSWVYHFNLFPTISQRLGESPEAFREIVGPSFRVTAWVGIVGATVGTLVAEPLCVLVFGNGFASAGPPLAVLVWVIPTTLLYGHARSALIAQDKQSLLLAAQLAGALTTLVLGLLLIPEGGAMGGAVTLLSSTLVVWAVAQRLASRQVAPLPFLSCVLRPAVLALGAGWLAGILGGSAWLQGALAGVLLTLCAPLVDPALLGDLRLLARAKGSRSPGSSPEVAP